ncbi:MAG: response regulator [Ignavibacterium sp.]|jgi:two-component system alkaline phosphatase synthesis response regulator PhoP|uniref:Response regulator n=1 Tax=Ignavibacterium album TaxID=591197 RepID=A0A7V2ZLU6_9BACT|nr:response regulator [Ignavibacterium album]MCA2005251.1 response regulator [Ignavibacterium sp.]MCX8104466.1 response regulator [Ignavibacterium album]
MSNKKKILLVDDDLDLLEQNKILIESKGYEVITANSSKEGWEVFKKTKPDACVIDLIMEEYDSGFVLCHRIKKDEHGKDIPVFILTSATYDTGFKFGASTSEEREWINADELINKPVVIDEFVQKLENYFEMKGK